MDAWLTRTLSHLFHCGVIEEDPFGGLGVEGEGTIVAAVVADHPHKHQLSLFGMLICNPVKELCPNTDKYTHQWMGRLVRDADIRSNQFLHPFID